MREILRRTQAGIHQPGPAPPPRQRGQFKFQRLPVRIEYDKQVVRGGRMGQLKGQTVGIFAPVRLAQAHSVPGELCVMCFL